RPVRGCPRQLPRPRDRRGWNPPRRRRGDRLRPEVAAMTDLDPVIHAAARLRIVAALAAIEPGDRMSFPRLQEHLGMTAGNLSTHLRKLEDAEYVLVTKTHQGR